MYNASMRLVDWSQSNASMTLLKKKKKMNFLFMPRAKVVTVDAAWPIFNVARMNLLLWLKVEGTN